MKYWLISTEYYDLSTPISQAMPYRKIDGTPKKKGK